MAGQDNIGAATRNLERSAELHRRYMQVRQGSEARIAPLSAEDAGAQSMPDASPAKWHLAHTTWFFETFLLVPYVPDYAVFDPTFGYLFNSYYEALGPRQPRPQRGMLTRPSLDQVLAYRAHVDAAMGLLLANQDEPSVLDLAELGLAHEEQHQELMLMDILHLFSLSPINPAYSPDAPHRLAEDPGPAGQIDFAGGLAEIGWGGSGFAFDNEGPQHRVFLEPYRIADRLSTNAEWLEFMADGGYRRPELWLAQGWAELQEQGWTAPLYWQDTDAGWRVMTLRGLQMIDPHAPVAHISFYEAEAFATWSGARLPTEAEWERAARDAPILPAHDRLGPSGADPTAKGLRQMFNELWCWTRSAYSPYPGFKPAPGAVGEYNGKFMIGQMVLRGGCCLTPSGHVRTSYRNFFQPGQRWMFSGVRLAWDAEPKIAKAQRGAGTFAIDVIAGLARPRKQLQAKYFYDAEGSALFEAICDLPEYYPTRTETALLRAKAHEMAAVISADAALVEFGSGASTKTRILLDAAPQIGVYVPIDISPDALAAAAKSIGTDYPNLEVAPLMDDFTTAMNLPDAATGRPRTGFFPGSTIGNFDSAEVVTFLKIARHLLGRGAAFLIGLDLVKAPEILVAAYDDAAGVTAAFNLNLLARINRELGGTFDLAKFRHRAIWNADESRIEMHLVSACGQEVRAAGHSFHFAMGETIHTENSHKFTLAGFEALAAQAGWRIERSWESPSPSFAMVRLVTA